MKTYIPVSRVCFITKNILIAIILLLFMAWNVNCFGQDTIVMNDQTKIACKVTEIYDMEIKYKSASNPDGPVYTTTKNNIRMIIYHNGTIEKFEFQKPWLIKEGEKKPVETIENKEFIQKETIPVQNDYKQPEKAGLKKVGARYTFGQKLLSENQMQSTLAKLGNKEISEHVKIARQSRGFQFVGFMAIPLGIIGLAEISQTDSDAKSTGAFCLALGVASIGTSIYLKSNREKHNEMAMKLYNENY